MQCFPCAVTLFMHNAPFHNMKSCVVAAVCVFAYIPFKVLWCCYGTALWLDVSLHYTGWGWAPGTLYGALFLFASRLKHLLTPPQLSAALERHSTPPSVWQTQVHVPNCTRPIVFVMRCCWIYHLCNSSNIIIHDKQWVTSYLPALLTPSPPLWYATENKEQNECPTVTSVNTAISIYAIVTQGQHTIIHLILNHPPRERWRQRFFFFLRASVRHNLGWVTRTATGAGGGCVRGLWRTERQSS